MTSSEPEPGGAPAEDSDRKRKSLPDRYRYKPMGLAYQGAMESVLAIVVGTGAGYWADGHFGTSPWLLVIGATIGFAAFVLRLTRLGLSLNRAASEEESQSPKGDSTASDSTKPRRD